MRNHQLASRSPLDPDHSFQAGWQVVSAGDFDGDEDILFQHENGSLAVWYLRGASLLRADFLNPKTTRDADWRVTGTLDLNRDGRPDLLLENRATLDLAVWYMDGVNLVAGALLAPATAGGRWRVVAP